MNGPDQVSLSTHEQLPSPLALKLSAVVPALNEAVAANLPPGSSRPSLEAMLSAVAELGMFDDKWQFRAHLGITVDFRSLGEWLTRRATSVGVQHALNDLTRYVETVGQYAFPYHHKLAVAGIHVDAETPLNQGVILKPFVRFPGQFAFIFERRGYQLPPTPSAVIETPASFRLEHSPRDAHHTVTQHENFQNARDVMLCLTAAGTRPAFIMEWTEPDESVPDLGTTNSLNFSRSDSFGDLPKAKTVELAGLRALHARWIGMPASERKHLRIALNRLNSALRQSDTVDAAIDLGIAIESLFLSERGPDRANSALLCECALRAS